jgi:hypothetical protein
MNGISISYLLIQSFPKTNFASFTITSKCILFRFQNPPGPLSLANLLQVYSQTPPYPLPETLSTDLVSTSRLPLDSGRKDGNVLFYAGPR